VAVEVRRRPPVLDLLFIALTLGSFALFGAYLTFCERV
jgi:hypothetical protein